MGDCFQIFVAFWGYLIIKMEHHIPDFWLAGRLITAAANRADLAELFDLDFPELFDLAELLERVDLADLVVSDLVDKALEGFED